MNDATKRALKILGIFLFTLALLMVIFYKFTRNKPTNEEVAIVEKEAQEIKEAKKEKSPYEGNYTTSGGSVEFEGMRISYFVISQREDSSFTGSVHIDEVGSNTVIDMDCLNVKVTTMDVFFHCSHPEKGEISFDGNTKGKEGGVIEVVGKILWSKNNTVLMDRALTVIHTVGN